MTALQMEAFRQPFGATMRTPLLVSHVAPDALLADPMHPRHMADDEFARLEHSIQVDGIVQPLVATREGMLIDGYQRLRVARRRGYETVPVIHLDVPPDRGRTIGLALNAISGDFDTELLPQLLVHLQSVPDIDLAATGFPSDELSRLLRRFDLDQKRAQIEFFDLDAALGEATREPRAKLGDLWGLGEHRLLCGDSTNLADVTRLLGGVPARMAICDPPYGVDFGDHGGHVKGTRRRKMANDALEPGEWTTFVRSWTGNLMRSVDGAFYVFMSCRHWPSVSQILEGVGAHWSATVCWKKDRFVIGTSDYQHGFEPIWYGWPEGKKHYWGGARSQSDVWEIARPSDSPLHPSMKPLPVIERAIENSSRVGDRILDLFMGSGTTLIAAERTGRTGLGIELDPIFVDIAIRRWQTFTGGTAVLVEDES